MFSPTICNSTMSSCFSGACAFARLWERWSLLGHSPPGIYGYFCSDLFSRIFLQVLDPQKVWRASPACVDEHRKDNQVRINRGDKVITHPGTTRAPWLLAPWSSRSSRWSAWCCNTFRTNSRKKALTILSLRYNFNSNRLSAWFSFRQSCASVNAVSGAWKSSWSSSTGLFFKRKVAGSSNISGMPTFWPPLKEPISVGPQSRLLAWYSEIWWATSGKL